MQESKVLPRVWVHPDSLKNPKATFFVSKTERFDGVEYCPVSELTAQRARLLAEVAQARDEAETWEKVAGEWMRDYDKLKNKYEPMIAVPSTRPQSEAPAAEGEKNG